MYSIDKVKITSSRKLQVVTFDDAGSNHLHNIYDSAMTNDDWLTSFKMIAH